MDENKAITINRIQRFGLTCDIETEQGVRYFRCGHEYVEIGGVKWATMNVGANNITDYGLFFQWGDTKGYTFEQAIANAKLFGESQYKFYQDGEVTKYNQNDNKTILEPCDDAVAAMWGNGWRMPTNDEYEALIASTHAFVEHNKGVVLCDKRDIRKRLFFPFSKALSLYTLQIDTNSLKTKCCYYWTRNGGHRLASLFCCRGCDCGLKPQTLALLGRSSGLAIRGIYDKRLDE